MDSFIISCPLNPHKTAPSDSVSQGLPLRSGHYPQLHPSYIVIQFLFLQRSPYLSSPPAVCNGKISRSSQEIASLSNKEGNDHSLYQYFSIFSNWPLSFLKHRSWWLLALTIIYHWPGLEGCYSACRKFRTGFKTITTDIASTTI